MRLPGALLPVLILLFLAASTASAQLRPQLRVPVSEGSPVPPALDEATAYLLTGSGRVRAVDRGSGREQWYAQVRCGADVFALAGEHVVCARGRHGVLRVLDARSGRLLGHARIEGGPYEARLVDKTLVFLGPRTGRILGYDVGRRTWTFDHRTDMDLSPDGRYVPAALGNALYYTQDEWRTLWAVNVLDGTTRLAAKSDTPVRTDEGGDAMVSHGLLLSRDESELLAFDLAAGSRAWRAGVDDLGGRPVPGAHTMAIADGGLFVLVERPRRPGKQWRGHAVVELRLLTGQIRRSWSLDLGLPWLAAARLAAQRGDGRCDLRFTSLTVVKGRPVVTLASPCAPREAHYEHGWTIGLRRGGGGVAWSSGPGVGARLVPTGEGVYALWGQPDVPHSQRRLTELDPDSGAVLSEHVTRHTPTWSLVDDGQLWLGTAGGPVHVLLL